MKTGDRTLSAHAQCGSPSPFKCSLSRRRRRKSDCIPMVLETIKSMAPGETMTTTTATAKHKKKKRVEGGKWQRQTARVTELDRDVCSMFSFAARQKSIRVNSFVHTCLLMTTAEVKNRRHQESLMYLHTHKDQMHC